MTGARLVLVTLLLLLGGCVPAGTLHPASSTALYAAPSHWLCRPGRTDACSALRQVVERGADGSVRPVADPPDPGIDCFYVYPTVTLSPIPANADNFAGDHANITAVAKVQAASFRTACRIFAPYYRQSTIVTYLLPEKVRQTYVANALADVTAAFDEYMAHDNGGRPIVLIGHSQGAELVTRLLEERFDDDLAMRAKLALAIVAGAPVWVPRGATVGGTLAHIPVCTQPGERGCVVTYKSFIAGTHPAAETRMTGAPGQVEACVNPATLDDRALSPEARRTARVPLTGTLLPPAAWSLWAVQGGGRSRVFTLEHDAYSAACVQEPAARLDYLSIAETMAPGDPRRALVLFDKGHLRSGLGLHVLDLQFPNAELVSLVKARAPHG